jgi:hypothetical protein
MTAPTPTLLNGLTALSSISIANALYDCVMGAWRIQFSSQKYSQITFCSGGYRVTAKGILAADATCTGFMSHGSAISDPLLNFTQSNGVACIWTATTDCFITGNFHIDPAIGIVAAGNSEESFSCESTGAFSWTWTVSTYEFACLKTAYLSQYLLLTVALSKRRHRRFTRRQRQARRQKRAAFRACSAGALTTFGALL